MSEGNGVTRREFERLERQVDYIADNGSPAARENRRRIEAIERAVNERFAEIDREIDRRFTSINRLLLAVFMTLLGGLITLVTVLATGAFSG